MADDTTDEPRRQIETALRAVRREGWKAAILHAVVDATAIFLAANLLLAVLDPGWLPAQISIPSALPDPVGSGLARFGSVGVPGSTIPAAGIGAVAVAVGIWARVRRPLVEQFEAVNPAVTEALRTARDAARDGNDSRMAARLYADVCERLRESSSVALVDTRRVAATVVVVLVLSLATVQVAVLDVGLFDDAGGQDTDAGQEPAREYTGLRNGSELLGDAQEVTAGDENITAQIQSTGGDEQIDQRRDFPTVGTGGADAGGVDSQQAGFAPAEDIEDATLVREYTLRIRESTEEE